MADRFSIKSLTVREEFKKTHVLPPILQVNLDRLELYFGMMKASHLAVLLGHFHCPYSLFQRR